MASENQTGQNLSYKQINGMVCIYITVSAEEDAEIEMGDIELDDVSRHQLSHREVFLSRQYENINANTIR